MTNQNPTNNNNSLTKTYVNPMTAIFGKPIFEYLNFSKTDVAILKHLALNGKKQSSKMEHELVPKISHASVYDSLKKLNEMGFIKELVEEREPFRTGLPMKTFDIALDGIYLILQVQTWGEREQTFMSHKEKFWFFQEYLKMKENGFPNLARFFASGIIDFYPAIPFKRKNMAIFLIEIMYPKQTMSPPQSALFTKEQLSTIQKEAKSYIDRNPEIISLMKEAVDLNLEVYSDIGKSIDKEFPL